MIYDPNQPTGPNNYPQQETEGVYPGDSGDNLSVDGWTDPRLDAGGEWAAILWPNVKRHGGLWTPEDFKERFPGTTLGDYEKYKEQYNISQENAQMASQNQLDSTYWAALQNFMEAQPGYEAYSQFIPQHLQRINELEQGQMDPYTGQLTVQDPWQRRAMLARQGQDYFGGIDEKYDEFGSMFKSTKDALLPQMQSNFDEQVAAPMAERLEMLGLSGSSPGMEMTAGVGQDFAIDKAMAGANADNTYAGQMMGVESARQGAMGQTGQQMQSLMQQGEATQRTNQGLQYQDWLTHQNDQYTRLGMGGQAMQTSAGALSASAGQGISAAQIPYDQGNAYLMNTIQNDFMAPYMDAASQQLPSSGGKK